MYMVTSDSYERIKARHKFIQQDSCALLIVLSIISELLAQVLERGAKGGMGKMHFSANIVLCSGATGNCCGDRSTN